MEDWEPQKLRVSAFCAPELRKLAETRPESVGIVVIQAEGDLALPEAVKNVVTVVKA